MSSNERSEPETAPQNGPGLNDAGDPWRPAAREPSFDEKMAQADEIMRRFRNTLRALAD